MQTAVNDHGNDTQYIFNGIFHILFDLLTLLFYIILLKTGILLDFCLSRKKGGTMKVVKTLIVVCFVVMIVACGHRERQANKATRKAADSQAAVSQERLKLIEDYKKCVEQAGEDRNKVEACDTYLKAAEALK